MVAGVALGRPISGDQLFGDLIVGVNLERRRRDILRDVQLVRARIAVVERSDVDVIGATGGRREIEQGVEPAAAIVIDGNLVAGAVAKAKISVVHRAGARARQGNGD
jgi:hypothetical protein